MVTMPGWSDQQTNSKIVEDAWKVGVRAKVDEHGIMKREEIAICIKEVMEGDRGKEMKMNSKKWKDDGDIEPETLVTHAYDHRRWRIAQTIEKLGFNLCFWV
jgi:pathogen-inducible salicylic acid glucosyltransferase